MANIPRIKELLSSTETWLVLRDADGQTYLQDVTGVPIAGPLAPEHAELISRLRNYFPLFLEEVEQARATNTMMQ